jgi:tetratricopeptide (TPR) repeat protein
MRYLLIILLMLVAWSAPALADASADCNQRRDYELSILACTTLIGQDSRNAIAYHNRGIAHHAKKDYDAAIADFTKAIEINPQFATAYTSRGLSYANKMDFDRAIADYTKAIEIDPKRAVAYINRGLAYRCRGEDDLAIADYTKAIEINPKSPVAFLHRGNAYHAKGDNDRAIADNAFHYFARGDQYADEREFDPAIAEYTKAFELNPRVPNASLAWRYFVRGIMYGEMGDPDRAIADFTRAIELNPKSTTYLSARGEAKFRKGQFKEASADFLRDIEIGGRAYPMLSHFLAQERAGETATPELEANAARLKTKEWPYAVIELYLGRRSPEAALAATSNAEERCQAYFFIGQWNILRGDRDEAAKALKVAADTCPRTWPGAQANAELKRLKP